MTVLSDHTTAAGRIEKHDRLEGPQGRLWTVTEITITKTGQILFSLMSFVNSLKPRTRRVDEGLISQYYTLKG